MWLNILVVVILVILSGTFAGLTLALFSIKLSTLERKIRLGDSKAKIVYKIRKNGNLLLCTLLLGNVASYTIMSVFLGSITSGVTASFIATSLIFVFGEILPQAIFPKYALTIGAKLSWLIWFLLVLFYPVAAPIAWVLDKLLGKEHPVLWSKKELGEIIKYHKEAGAGIIDKDEERIILGALSFSDLTIAEIMITLKDVFYLEPQTKLTNNVLKKIQQKGFSRIPVCDGTNHEISGILYVIDLINMDNRSVITVDQISRKSNLIFADKSMKLDNLLNLLVISKMHMALIVNDLKQLIGIATMEDILEEILKLELEDKKVRNLSKN